MVVRSTFQYWWTRRATRFGVGLDLAFAAHLLGGMGGAGLLRMRATLEAATAIPARASVWAIRRLPALGATSLRVRTTWPTSSGSLLIGVLVRTNSGSSMRLFQAAMVGA